METLEQTESLIVDYIKLSPDEFTDIKYKLLNIHSRMSEIEHRPIQKFLGYEKGYEPITITIESDSFAWNFSVIVEEPKVSTESKPESAPSDQ